MLRITRSEPPHLRLHGQIVDAVEENYTLMREGLKVLKVMNEATGRLDLNEFAQMVELTPNQTVGYMQELLKANFLKKTGGGYAITDAGRTILRAFTPVQAGMEFHFYRAVGRPSSFAAKNLLEFYETIKQIAPDSLEFHLYRGDFENWTRTALNEADFAEEIATLKNAKLTGENLRIEILKLTQARYGFEKLS